jgi:hypothetical protein
MKNQLINKIKQYGLLNAPLLALKVVIRVIFKITWKSYYLMYRQVTESDGRLVENNLGNNMEIKKLDINDLCDGYCKEYINNKKLEIFRNRLKNPLIEGYGLFVQGNLACYGWINYEKLEISSYTSFPLPPGSALVFDAFCHPDYRRRGCHKIISAYRIYRVCKSSIKNIFVIVLKNNKPSIKTQISHGFKITQSFTVLKIGEKEYNTVKPVIINF